MFAKDFFDRVRKGYLRGGSNQVSRPEGLRIRHRRAGNWVVPVFFSCFLNT
jgi:hypothetical protein